MSAARLGTLRLEASGVDDAAPVALREVGLHHAHLRARTFELGCERSELVGTDGEVEHQLGA